jgi:hypothetical protein
MDFPSNCVALAEDGSAHRIRFERLPITAMARVHEHLTRDAKIRLPNAYEFNGQPVNIAMHEGLYYASTILTSITLATAYLADETGTLTPCFAADDNAIPLRATWPTPPGITVRFGIVAEAGYRLLEARLFVQTSDPGFFRLPLPNVYEDAKICLGSRADGFRDAILVKLMTKAIEHFTNATWNADLLTEAVRDGAKAIFRIPADKVGTDSIEFEAVDPRPHLIRCNHPSMEVMV